VDDGVLELRDLLESDRDLLFSWRTDERINFWMLRDGPESKTEHDQWFGRQLVDRESVFRVIVLRGIPVGIVSLHAEGGGQMLSLGIYVSADTIPAKGVGSEAVAKVLRLTDVFPAARCVKAEVFSDNLRAIRLYERLGFTRVAGSEREVLKGNAQRSVVCYEFLLGG